MEKNSKFITQKPKFKHFPTIIFCNKFDDKNVIFDFMRIFWDISKKVPHKFHKVLM